MNEPEFELRIWAHQEANEEFLNELDSSGIKHKRLETVDVIAIKCDNLRDIMGVLTILNGQYIRHKDKKLKTVMMIHNNRVEINSGDELVQLLLRLKKKLNSEQPYD